MKLHTELLSKYGFVYRKFSKSKDGKIRIIINSVLAIACKQEFIYKTIIKVGVRIICAAKDTMSAFLELEIVSLD